MTPLLALALLAAAPAPDLLTTADRTGFERTGRHEEAVRLCRDFAVAFPRRARCAVYGTTPEGRALVALAASADGALDPATARARRRPVVLFQGGIHAGEIDGKDAGFMVLRELLASKDGGPLARVTAVFVPIVNVDGHERFGPAQRPNQRGPAETGWRTTAQNLNLNRDYVKADAPEMRALLRLLGAWDPVAYADLHVTDGAQFEQDVSVLVEPKLGYAEALRPSGAALSDALLARLTADGHLPVDFYPEFTTPGEPTTGFARGVAPPRFSQSYWAARNRIGILLETHSWRPYRHRVKATAAFLRALLDLAARDGAAWEEAAREADRAGAALAGREVPVAWKPGATVRTIDFLGYAYTRVESPALGRTVVRYDESRPEVWRVPLVEDVAVARSVTLPAGGWIVPAAEASTVAARLRPHGIAFEQVSGARADAAVEVFRATEAKLAPASYEGRQGAEWRGAWARERRALAAGWLWVPAAQPGARLAAFLLEPESPDSLAAWGFFNAALERKEHVEDYVLGPFADALLARDPAVRAEFERRLADPAFAKDRDARAEFFYRRHPAADEAWRRYPILRAAARP